VVLVVVVVTDVEELMIGVVNICAAVDSVAVVVLAAAAVVWV